MLKNDREQLEQKESYPWLDSSDERKYMTDQEILDKYIDLETSCLTSEEKKEVMEMLYKYKEAFSLRDEIGTCPSVDVEIVTKFILPSIGDLNFSKLNYDNTCAYLDNKNTHSSETRKHILDLITFCKKIEPFVIYYKRLIKSYNNTAHNILENEINLILPQIPRKKKCGIITMLVSSFIGLAYEGISSFLHHKQNKALHRAVRAMDSKTTIQHNTLMQLENSMLMYGIYNAETLEKLIKTVHNIHNTTSSHERLFAGQQSSLTLK